MQQFFQFLLLPIYNTSLISSLTLSSPFTSNNGYLLNITPTDDIIVRKSNIEQLKMCYDNNESKSRIEFKEKLNNEKFKMNIEFSINEQISGVDTNKKQGIMFLFDEIEGNYGNNMSSKKKSAEYGQDFEFTGLLISLKCDKSPKISINFGEKKKSKNYEKTFDLPTNFYGKSLNLEIINIKNNLKINFGVGDQKLEIFESKDSLLGNENLFSISALNNENLKNFFIRKIMTESIKDEEVYKESKSQKIYVIVFFVAGLICVGYYLMFHLKSN